MSFSPYRGLLGEKLLAHDTAKSLALRDVALVVGWFSIPGERCNTVGDVMSANTAVDWLTALGLHTEVLLMPELRHAKRPGFVDADFVFGVQGRSRYRGWSGYVDLFSHVRLKNISIDYLASKSYWL